MPLQIGECNRVRNLENCLRIILSNVREKHSKRRENASMLRHKHSPNLQGVCDLASMHCSRTAEGQQCKVARIIATLYRHTTDSAFHIGVGNLYDALRQAR